MRKIDIPYSNFLQGTIITADHFNTNFDEVEHCFNQLYEEYVARVNDTYNREEVDNTLNNAINTLSTILNNKFDGITDELFLEDSNIYSSIANLSNEMFIQDNAVYSSMVRLTDAEINDVVHDGTMVEYTTGFITKEQIIQIIGGTTFEKKPRKKKNIR